PRIEPLRKPNQALRASAHREHERAIKAKEETELNNHGHDTTQRVEAVLAHYLHLFFASFAWVFEFLPDLLKARLRGLHALHGLELPDSEGKRREAHQQS